MTITEINRQGSFQQVIWGWELRQEKTHTWTARLRTGDSEPLVRWGGSRRPVVGGSYGLEVNLDVGCDGVYCAHSACLSDIDAHFIYDKPPPPPPHSSK